MIVNELSHRDYLISNTNLFLRSSYRLLHLLRIDQPQPDREIIPSHFLHQFPRHVQPSTIFLDGTGLPRYPECPFIHDQRILPAILKHEQQVTDRHRSNTQDLIGVARGREDDDGDVNQHRTEPVQRVEQSCVFGGSREP